MFRQTSSVGYSGFTPNLREATLEGSKKQVCLYTFLISCYHLHSPTFFTPRNTATSDSNMVCCGTLAYHKLFKGTLPNDGHFIKFATIRLYFYYSCVFQTKCSFEQSFKTINLAANEIRGPAECLSKLRKTQPSEYLRKHEKS